MPNPQVLILDDDERWLALHERRLKNAGIDYYPTQHSTDAIEFAKNNNTKIALIDEILFVPPVFNEQEGELQHWQGRGVVREIINHGLDTQFIFITSAPNKRGKLTEKEFWQEVVSLKILPGVVEVINKQEIDHNIEDSYERIINFIRKFHQDAHKAGIFNLNKTPFNRVSQQLKIIRIHVSLGFFNINLDRTQNMTATNWILPNNKGILNVDNTVNGHQNGTQNNYSAKQDLIKAAEEIHAILDYLSQIYPTDTEPQKQIFATEFKKEIERKPELRTKIISALQSGGKETLKQLCSHPAVDIAIAVYEGWQNPS
ncbi:hypothetical protein [Nostoc sp. NMS8]|uniref:hypothetical protein n=1 Tax=Nostoc sp. NMS8 TaxID=2815392 RepID=UPI0025DBD498|nr:hypothetical protein [Nostoc sp. NMS8]MBN3957456.1 hypothetical protein [Nostoc sp. NMS8]